MVARVLYPDLGVMIDLRIRTKGVRGDRHAPAAARLIGCWCGDVRRVALLAGLGL